MADFEADDAVAPEPELPTDNANPLEVDFEGTAAERRARQRPAGEGWEGARGASKKRGRGRGGGAD